MLTGALPLPAPRIGRGLASPSSCEKVEPQSINIHSTALTRGGMTNLLHDSLNLG